jgi:hypothetical protein
MTSASLRPKIAPRTSQKPPDSHIYRAGNLENASQFRELNSPGDGRALAKKLIDAIRRLPSAIMQKTQPNKSGYRPIELEHTLQKKSLSRFFFGFLSFLR